MAKVRRKVKASLAAFSLLSAPKQHSYGFCQSNGGNGGLTGLTPGEKKESKVKKVWFLLSKEKGRVMRMGFGILLPLTFAISSVAQDDGQGGFTAASRSAHETVWQRLERPTNQVGHVRTRVRSFVELATGLNFFDEATQQFQPSREEWEVYRDGIVARLGQHKAILSHHLADGVDVLQPDGVTRLVSTAVSLGFYDPVDGSQVVIAELWNASVGEWVWRNLAGINPDDNNPSFKNAIMYPRPGGGITNCSATFDTIRGTIRSSWTNAGSSYALSVTVPPNATASVFLLGATNLASITEGGLPATNAVGLLSTPVVTNGAALFQVGSGSYLFNASF